MPPNPVTTAEAYRYQHRWRLYSGLIALVLLLVLGLVALFFGLYALWRFYENETETYVSIDKHFMYGSIGSEPESGMPYWIWKVLPSFYPEAFGQRSDYSAFGFLYETDEDGRQRDLPIGISKRNVSGVDVVWLNCATCHVGTWRAGADAPHQVVRGMPSNNLDFHRFVEMVLHLSTDRRLAPEQLFAAMEAAGADLGPIDRLVWRMTVLPRFREGLLTVRAGLAPLQELRPAWGPGRVDTFNPYKVLKFGMPPGSLTPEERIGVADLPSIFNQGPREGMNLHWDGNNPSLQERNLSAAIGAGVTPETVDHDAIGRVADWLRTLSPPPSPHRPDAEAVARGATIYRGACAGCHGWNTKDGYVFEGAKLGKVDPNATLGTDPARLDSYTPALQQRQVSELFAGTPYAFRHFHKTDGYANLPLDGLWLRGPYLHNGSVPSLADLLLPPEERPRAFVRGSDVVDGSRGGFISPPCESSNPPADGFCFDTTLPGNGNGGHRYGTELASDEKADLLAYLLTF